MSTKVPIEEVPSIMRALGFFPSEQEVRVVLVFFVLSGIVLLILVSD